MLDIVGIDGSCLDHIISLERMPRKNEEVNILAQSWQGGGKVATALVAAARLGARAGLLGKMGDDAIGDFLCADLADSGVDMSAYIRQAGRSSTYCVSLAEKQTGGRSFMVEWGTHDEMTAAELNLEYLTSARCLHLWRAEEIEVFAARAAREAGMLVAFDADEYSEKTMENIGLIDVFIGSEFFYNALFSGGDRRENLRALNRKGPQTVIFTFGERGLIGLSKGEYFELPAFSIQPVDTTGAGDVFHGAYLAAALRGMEALKAARYASAVSAVKCLYLGGRAGIPDGKTVEAFLRDGSYDDTELKARAKRYAKSIL